MSAAIEKEEVLTSAPSAASAVSCGTSSGVAVSRADRTGRKHVLRNVASGWMAQALQIVSGFVLPRLISDQLGTDSLGLWDFGWATVSYFSLLQGGIVSSVNRYVAKYQASGDTINLNVAASSVGMVLKGVAILIAVLSVAFAWQIPELMASKLSGLTNEARWVILCLGLTIAVQVQGAIYGGVLTGCHQWSIHNTIKGLATVLSVAGGIVVILLGGTIVWLAGVTLLAEVVLRFAQRLAARRCCPELKISFRHFSPATAFEMSRFGGKTYIQVVSQIIFNQTTSLIVASSLGTAALALFSRPRSLIRAFTTVIESNSMILVPMVAALDTETGIEEVRRLAVTATRYAVFACLPAIIALTTMGGQVMHVWMGESYVDPLLLGIFAVAGLIEAMCFPLYRVSMGLNRHGRLGLLNLISACFTAVVVGTVALTFDGGLREIALAMMLPSMAVNAIILPWLAARELRTRVLTLLLEVAVKPALCCLPGTALLLGTLWMIDGSATQELFIGALAGAAGSGWLYWQHAVPQSMKLSLRRLVTR